jgi:hypothetical protein
MRTLLSRIQEALQGQRIDHAVFETVVMGLLVGIGLERIGDPALYGSFLLILAGTRLLRRSLEPTLLRLAVSRQRVAYVPSRRFPGCPG